MVQAMKTKIPAKQKVLNHSQSSNLSSVVETELQSSNASGITLLLADHEKFGFSERYVVIVNVNDMSII